jgi:hypothetical protein
MQAEYFVKTRIAVNLRLPSMPINKPSILFFAPHICTSQLQMSGLRLAIIFC